MKKAIRDSKAPAAIGPYSPAIQVGNQLFVSGQIPVNSENGALVKDTIENATKQVMENITRLLEAADFNLNDIVKCSIFLKDFNDFKKMNDVYSSFFEKDPPARETVEVSRLPLDALIEISCIAIKS